MIRGAEGGTGASQPCEADVVPHIDEDLPNDIDDQHRGHLLIDSPKGLVYATHLPKMRAS